MSAEDTHLTARVYALERWREAVDLERGSIMHDLGAISSSITAIKENNAELSKLIENRFNDVLERIEERPSRSEFDRDLASIRAKAKGPIGRLSKLEIVLPGGAKFKLFGVNGVTIVLALVVIVLGLLLWLKK
jgi:hypothetical protein